MAIHIVRLGTPRTPAEGLRIGTVRRPPRGVPRGEYASRDYYDVWYPNLSPSPELMAQAKAARDGGEWNRFERHFMAEMAKPEASHSLDLLAALSHTTDFAIGCYCEDENRCHRSILRKLLQKRGAALA